MPRDPKDTSASSRERIQRQLAEARDLKEPAYKRSGSGATGAEGKEGKEGPAGSAGPAGEAGESITVSVKKYGAKGDGSTNDTAAIKAAIAALGTQGTLFFPKGVYVINEELLFDLTSSIILRGAGGVTAGNTPASTILFTGEGTGRCISARSSTGFRIYDLGVMYTKAGFTGTVVDFSRLEGKGDTSYAKLDGALIGGQGVRTALGLNLREAQNITTVDSFIMNCDIGVRGQESAGQYSNAIRFINSVFGGHKTISLRNAGEAWACEGCTFIPLNGGIAGAYDYTAGIVGKAVSFSKCWFGDVTAGEGIWIKFNGEGFGFEDNECGGNAASKMLQVSSASSGIDIRGGNKYNTFKTAIELIPGCSRYWVSPAASSVSVTNRVTIDGGATDCGGGVVTDAAPSDLEPGILVPQLDAGISASQAELTLAKEAGYIGRFTVDFPIKAIKVGFLVTTASSVDDPVFVVIYNSKGERIKLSAETKGVLNSEGVKTVTLEVTLSPNNVYYAGLLCKSIGGTAAKVAAINLIKAGMANIFGAGFPTALTGQQNSLTTFPEKFVSVGGVAQVPLLAIRTS
jgi:Pectate lyase superfamily protein